MLALCRITMKKYFSTHVTSEAKRNIKFFVMSYMESEPIQAPLYMYNIFPHPSHPPYPAWGRFHSVSGLSRFESIRRSSLILLIAFRMCAAPPLLSVASSVFLVPILSLPTEWCELKLCSELSLPANITMEFRLSCIS